MSAATKVYPSWSLASMARGWPPKGAVALSATCVSNRPCAGRGLVGHFGTAPRLARIIFLLMAFGFLGVTNAQLPPSPPQLPRLPVGTAAAADTTARNLGDTLPSSPPPPPSLPTSSPSPFSPPPAQPPRPAQPGWHVERHGRRRYPPPPHGTMRRSSSRAATRRRLHHPTARHQGGWAALRCPGLHQAFEVRSCHRLAPCPPSRGACASRSLWRGWEMSCWVVRKQCYTLRIKARGCSPGCCT